MLRRLVTAGLAAALLVSCSSDKEGSSPGTTLPLFETTTTSALPSTPVIARLLSPERGSVQGSGGRGLVVALTFTARDPATLPGDFRFGGALPAPAPAVKTGANPAFPGLVVGMSTTSSALGGPSANLANLFQIISPATQLDGSKQVTAVWTNNAPDFGSDVDITLVAFVLSGAAPDVIPASQANLDVISNPIEVTFRVSPATGAGTPATTSTVAVATTTTKVGATTTTTKPGATTTTPTTVRATTTTARATTSTTACLLPGILC
jgi:hypothetical protein